MNIVQAVRNPMLFIRTTEVSSITYFDCKVECAPT